MATLFAVNYVGLRPKGSYDEIIDRLELERPTLREPNRRAKFLRESPQIANLLDGEGNLAFVELGRHQLAAAKQRAVEQSVREAASVPGAATAQVLRAAEPQRTGARISAASMETNDRFAQTREVKVTDAGSPAWRAQTHSGGTPTDMAELSGAQLFDIGSDDGMEEDLLMNLNAALDAQEAATEQQQAKIAAIVAKHLGEEVAAQLAFAHQMASSSSSSAAAMTLAQQAAYIQQMSASSGGSVPMETESSKAKRAGNNPEAFSAPKAKAKAGSSCTAVMALPQQARAQQKSARSSGSAPMETEASRAKRAADIPEDFPAPKAKSKASPEPKKGMGEPRDTGRSHANKKQADESAAPAAGLALEGPTPKSGESQAVGSQSSSSSQASPPARAKHGVKPIEGKDRDWWLRQNVATIKTQAELRGHRFSDLDTKGGKSRVRGKVVKVLKFKKVDYLEVLFKLLKL